jgi:hypothetical protein
VNVGIHHKVSIQSGILLKVLQNEIAMVRNGWPSGCKLAGGYTSGPGTSMVHVEAVAAETP